MVAAGEYFRAVEPCIIPSIRREKRRRHQLRILAERVRGQGGRHFLNGFLVAFVKVVIRILNVACGVVCILKLMGYFRRFSSGEQDYGAAAAELFAVLFKNIVYGNAVFVRILNAAHIQPLFYEEQLRG